MHDHHQDAETQRLSEDSRREKNWKRWGPYLSDRQWGTIREDYSPGGDAWGYFTHDQARSRAYRWGEDGLLGITDRECRLCFGLALWNGKDPILKERLFGLANGEGNHGEDVKECYFYLDATPTHTYLKALYKYPQAAFPYEQLIEENRRRNRFEQEFELLDTGIFNESRYFDVTVEYAKASPNDLLLRITAINRGPEAAVLHLLPMLWCRNTWSWGRNQEGYWAKPVLQTVRNEEADSASRSVACQHESLGRYVWTAGPGANGQPATLLFTENETNQAKLFGVANASPFVKDAFHDCLIHGRTEAVNPAGRGTKVGAHYLQEVPAGGQFEVHLRLFAEDEAPAEPFGSAFEEVFARRIREADEYYSHHVPQSLSAAERNVARQAYAGLLWSKQYFGYVIQQWLEGDPAQPAASPGRREGRNNDWPNLYNRDVLLMPDKWEYPYYCAWDLAFHTVAVARVDPELAKEQLLLFLREWYMNPNGQVPAYEWNFSDVNPPVHAWACWRVYKMTGARGQRDRRFLARVFQKLLINFTWWVNRKDVAGKNLFAGGFLGLDNIGLFDRSKPLAPGVVLAQADGTAWMAFYCLTMLSMALELAHEDLAYSDVASKFFEHFVAIVDAMNTISGTGLWDDQDGFYYDGIRTEGHGYFLRTRSMVGLLPLIAVEVLSEEMINRLPGFKKRQNWFLKNRQDLGRHITLCEAHPGDGKGHQLLAIPSRERLEKVLRYLLDEAEFLSPYGIRALSRYHLHNPYVFQGGDGELRVDYVAGESTSNMFGGNSNWRGPVWFPVNYLLVESLQRYHHFYGDTLRVECPTGSGRMMNLMEVASEIASRLTRLLLPDADGRRACHGADGLFAADPHWRDLVLFYEYFNGDTGRGCGASHQTGWTALVVQLFDKFLRPGAEQSLPRQTRH